jgi:hypothetical protein
MRDEGSTARRTAWAAAAAASLLAAAPAMAEPLRGWAQVQYQNLSRVQSVDNQEWWLTAFQVDYATRAFGTTEVFSQVQFNELNFTGRPDRSRRPRGTFRVSHSLFGLFASYRPDLVTDARNITTEQQELMLTGYVQRARLPRLDGSWVRRHQNPNAYGPATDSETRNLTSAYESGPLNLRAGYGDQTRESAASLARRTVEQHFNVGSTLRFARRRANGQVSYDFSQNRRKTDGSISDVTRVHNVALSGGATLSRKSSLNTVYNYRRSNTGQPGAPAINEQDGALTLEHRPSQVVRVAGGGGVRSATDANRQDVESYVMASVGADGQARPGLRLGAGMSHSWNWLPHDNARPIDTFRSNAQMRLANGLDLSGDAQVTAAARRPTAADSVQSTHQVVLQAGAGLRALPLRSIALTASVRRYRTGSSLGGEGVSANAYVVDLRWNPSGSLQMGGNWGRSGSLGATEPDRTIIQTDFQWSPSPFLQASGTYMHTDRPGQGVNPSTSVTASSESYSGRLVMALTRDLRTTIQYSEADPGLISHARQVNVTVTQSFRR